MYLISWEPSPEWSSEHGLSFGITAMLHCPVCRATHRVTTTRWTSGAGIKMLIAYCVGDLGRTPDSGGRIVPCSSCGVISALPEAHSAQLREEMTAKVTVQWLKDWAKTAGANLKFEAIRP